MVRRTVLLVLYFCFPWFWRRSQLIGGFLFWFIFLWCLLRDLRTSEVIISIHFPLMYFAWFLSFTFPWIPNAMPSAMSTSEMQFSWWWKIRDGRSEVMPWRSSPSFEAKVFWKGKKHKSGAVVALPQFSSNFGLQVMIVIQILFYTLRDFSPWCLDYYHLWQTDAIQLVQSPKVCWNLYSRFGISFVCPYLRFIVLKQKFLEQIV
jgi:hypothetical protein